MKVKPAVTEELDPLVEAHGLHEEASDDDHIPLANFRQRPDASPKVNLILANSWRLFIAILCLIPHFALHSYLTKKSCSEVAAYTATDLEPSKPAIEIIQKKFTSGLRFDENGTLYRTFKSDEPQFVGIPNSALDRAWAEITWNQDLFINRQEAERFGPNIHLVEEFNLYETGVEVFHGLHCLNMIRKALYLDYYPQDNQTHLMTHVDHCIDALRQSIMCTGDMTPLPAVWSESTQRLIPDFEQVHTCRNFTRLQEWAVQRSANIGAQDNAARMRRD